MRDDEIREQVERICKSELFAKSERLSSLLRYVVACTLNREAPSKEYSLGRDVFGRGKNYDPRVDPVVRVTATRLRAKLNEYYSTAGARDDIVITLPAGGYVPELVTRTPPPRAWGLLRRAAVAAVVALIALAIAISSLMPLRRSNAGVPSIAILPFDNLSGAAELDSFADGLTEQLIDALSAVPRLNVVARTSAFVFKGKRADVRDIGKRLGVTRVLEGSVRRQGGKLRVTAQLNRTDTGFHEWSKTLERDAGDSLTAQDEFARVLAAAVGGRPVSQPEATTEAQALYLQGRYVVIRGRNADALDFYRQAAEKDPRFARAYTGMADAYANLANNPGIPGAVANAKSSVKRALQLDPDLAETHISLARIALVEWDWRGALSASERAVAIAPGNSRAYWVLSQALLMQSRSGDSVDALRQAVALDPISPAMNANYARALYHNRRFNEAIEQCRRTLTLDPTYVQTYAPLALGYVGKGQFSAALAALDQAKSLPTFDPEDQNWLGLEGHALGAAGRRTEALAILDKLRESARKRPKFPTAVARVYLGLGDTLKALEQMEEAFTLRDPFLSVMLIEPRSDPLRTDPRFVKLRQQVFR